MLIKVQGEPMGTLPITNKLHCQEVKKIIVQGSKLVNVVLIKKIKQKVFFSAWGDVHWPTPMLL